VPLEYYRDMTLDPDDPRPPYLPVASSLRAGILTRQFTPGEKLPSGTALASHYGVARMTVQQAVRLLRDEGLVVSRTGSGVFVRERTERPVGLRPHIERAFEARDVTLDFFGFSGETLQGAMQEPLDQIRSGRHTPRSISVRALVPDGEKPWTLPCDAKTREDDPAFRGRSQGIMRRHMEPLVHSIIEIGELGLVESATAEVRSQPAAPLFKLYIINGHEAFHGFYPVREHAVKIEGSAHKVFDLMGKDTTLFHHEATDDPEAVGSQFVSQATTWFESIWTNISTEIQL
jgi:DNA-binding transcriptional regulator YhcF (GntR family)